MRTLIVCLLCLLTASPVRAACSVQPVTQVPLRFAGTLPLLPLQIDDQPATFVLDTGAARSVVTEAAATRLGLRMDEWVGTTMRGVGGVVDHRNADPRSITLGGVTLHRRTLARDNSLAVGGLSRPGTAGHAIDGLLGRDFLSVFDLDLDVPGRRLTLYSVQDCAGRFLPWSGAYASVPVQNPMEQALVAILRIDRTPLRALLDTGSTASLIAAPGMVRLGLSVAGLMDDPGVTVSGLGPRRVIMRRHRFRSMQVDDTTIQGPELWVAPIHLTPIVDMLLGADWLAGKRVWISWATRQLFVAANP
jgi:hypothetical protein